MPRPDRDLQRTFFGPIGWYKTIAQHAHPTYLQRNLTIALAPSLRDEDVVTTGRRAAQSVTYELRYDSPRRAHPCYRSFSLQNLRCLICTKRACPCVKTLALHLLTHHDRLRFGLDHIGRRAAQDGTVKITVELPTPATAIDDTSTGPETEWTWQRPTSHRFDLDQYLRGNEGWRVTAMSDADMNHGSPGDGPSKARHVVPPHPSGGTFFRNSTKRPIAEGEPVSDSDEDPDDAWLVQRQEDAMEDFQDVSRAEKDFMKRLNAFLRERTAPADRDWPELMLNFTREHRGWLSRPDMSAEFLKHGSKLVVYGRLHPRVLRTCAAMIAGADTSLAPPLVGTPKEVGSALNPALCICGKPWSVGSEVMCENVVSRPR